MNWQGCRTRRLWPNSMSLRHFLNGLRNTTQILSEELVYGSRWKRKSPKYNGGVIHSSTTQYCWLQYSLIHSLALSFLVWPPVPTHCRCRGLLLHLITVIDTHTLGRTTLDEGSARRRGLCLHNTQHSQERNIHAPSGIRTRNSSKRAAADLRLRPRGHWDRLLSYLFLKTGIFTFQI
jgi:hypothetical protein